MDWGDSLWAAPPTAGVVIKKESSSAAAAGAGAGAGAGTAAGVGAGECPLAASDAHVWTLGWPQFLREERHRLAVQVNMDRVRSTLGLA